LTPFFSPSQHLILAAHRCLLIIWSEGIGKECQDQFPNVSEKQPDLPLGINFTSQAAKAEGEVKMKGKSYVKLPTRDNSFWLQRYSL
jgi:hypothetical protein